MSNLNPHNHPSVKQTFEKGCSDSLHPEVASGMAGYYYDALNYRLTSVDGETLAPERVKGEVVFLEIPELNEFWTSVWLGIVRNRKVAIWVHDSASFPSCVTVDEAIVLQSSNFTVTKENFLQAAKDESCNEGEIFCTLADKPPFFLSIEDMLFSKATGSEKYFADFVFENYSVNFSAPADHPVYTGLVNVGSGNGQPVGKYVYAIRLIDSTGNAANMSYPTPEIFVPRRYILDASGESASNNNYFPALKNYGADADPTLSTAYAPRIKFRVTNFAGYGAVEIIRWDYNSGTGIGFTPVKSIIKTIPISQDEISVIEFIDSISNEDDPKILTLDEISGDSLEIESAHAVRYFDRRVELADITYKKLDEGDVEFIQESGDNHMFPVSTDIGKLGHAEAVNEAYKKSFLHGDLYSFGFLGIPTNLQKTFIKPIRDNILMPSRREVNDSFSLDSSTNPVRAATVDGTVDNTFEVTNYESGSQQTLSGGGWNILESVYSYKPFAPKSVDDLSSDFERRRIKNIYFEENASTSQTFKPRGYNPNYHTLGMALRGLSSYPSWLKAFSIVRRPKAGRVVFQGLATYKLKEQGSNATAGCNKLLDEMWLFSPDLESGMLSAEQLVAFENAQSGDYKVEMISPLGFFSDIYNAHKFGAGGKNDACIDMVTYPRVIYDSANGCNPEHAFDNYPGIPDGAIPHALIGYTAYGNWRNDTVNPNYPANANGKKLFTIDSVSRETLEEGINRWSIKLTDNIYLATNFSKEFKSIAAKRSHEPWYIVNIVLEGALVGTENIKNYQPTEHYQKIESIVGRSDGSNYEEFEVVDERWEDFHSISGGVHDVTKHVFVDYGDFVNRRYVNINNLSVFEIALVDADIAAFGGTLFDGIPVYGKFKSTTEKLIFGSLDLVSTLPVGALVKVFYDNRFPCVCYGDTYIGDALGVMIHNQKKSASNWDADNDFRLNAAFPYFRWDKEDAFHYIRKTEGAGSEFEPDGHTYSLSRIRQMITIYTVNSLSHIPLAYKEHFPLVNYIQRPNKYDPIKLPSEQNIYPEYEEDYPLENDRWRYGGFRLKQVPINSDYSQKNETPSLFSRPVVGFIENLSFCSRIIWSLERPINVSYYPGLRTFPINHVYDLDDRRGSIRFLYDCFVNGVRNLYAICKDDIARLITNNAQIGTLSGEALSVIGNTGSSEFISKDIFLGQHGMPDDTWRSASETENGLFFLNYDSIFYFDGSQTKDIVSAYYRNTVYNQFIKSIQSAGFSKMKAVFDTRYREYWLDLTYGTINNAFTITHNPSDGEEGTDIVDFTDLDSIRCLAVDNGNSYADIGITNLTAGGGCLCNSSSSYINVYNYTGTTRGTLVGTMSPNTCYTFFFTNKWILKTSKLCKTCNIDENRVMINFGTGVDNFQGKLSYDMDFYDSKDSRTFGAKNGKIYEIHSGNIINEANIDSSLKFIVSQEAGVSKEFVRFRISSSRKPLVIRFYANSFDAASTGFIAADEMRDYGGFEQYIPRRIDNKLRHQGKYLYVEIFDNEEESIVVRGVDIQIKKLQ